MPPALVGSEDPNAGPGAQQLLDEQRIARRPLGDAFHERSRQRVADELAHELLGVARREQRQVESLAALHPRRPLVEQHRPRARHHQPAGAPRRGSCELEEREQVRRGPVDVLDEPDRGASAGDRVESLEPGLEELLSLGGRSLRLGRTHGAEQLRDHGRACLRRAGLARERGEIAGRRHELADRIERREHVGAQARTQDRRAGRRGGELVQQPRLADARGSDHRDSAGRADERTKTRDLLLAAEGRRVQPAERPLPRPLGVDTRRAPGGDGLALPLQLERRQSLQLDRVRDRERRRLSNRHRLRFPGRLQTRRDVDHVAGDRPTLGARLPVHRLAARDAHPQPERAGREPEPGADALHRGHESQPRTHGPLRIVVADARRTEDGHRGVADELLELAAVPRDRLAHGVEIRVLHERHVLGVELLGQRREADEIGEENRHDAPLHRPLAGHERVYDEGEAAPASAGAASRSISRAGRRTARGSPARSACRASGRHSSTRMRCRPRS